MASTSPEKIEIREREAAREGQHRRALGRARPALLRGRRDAPVRHLGEHDPVHQLAPVLGLGDRVEHALAAHAAADRHGAPVAPGGPGRGAPPHQHAVPAGRPLVRVEAAAGDRVDPVRRDQHVGPHRAPGPAPHRVGEMRRDPALVLQEAGQREASAHGLPAQALPHGRVQHALEAPAMDRELRHRMARMGAAQLAPDLLALAVVVAQFPGADRHPVEGGEQAEIGEFADRVRQGVDADPDLAHLRGLLVDLGPDAAPVQHQGGGEPADPGADDDDAHGLTPPRAGAGNRPRAGRRSPRGRPGRRSARDCAGPRTGRRGGATARPRIGTSRPRRRG